jgi:putative PIN family toxin of toxin-antitoxin system
MSKDRLVLDCNVYVQALLDFDGPAGRCVAMALEDRVELFVCPEVIREIHELPEKKVGIKHGITLDYAHRFTEDLLEHATFINQVPATYIHPIDPDDSVYVNLAIVAKAKLIVSNDNHLLNLNNPAKPWSQVFRDQFHDIKILKPADYLQYCRQRDQLERGEERHP